MNFIVSVLGLLTCISCHFFHTDGLSNHVQDQVVFAIFADESTEGLEKEEVMEALLEDERLHDFDTGPPPHDQPARMARYIVHHSDWAAMATLSTRPELQGSPFANVFSVSDGANVREASGRPYMYLTPMELSVKDLKVNNNASLTMSLAQGKYCEKKNLDPEDPRCAHVILTGKVVEVPPQSEEEDFARRALFSRHEEMPEWPADHAWFFAKLEITSILVLDYFGGAKDVPVKQYFEATPY